LAGHNVELADQLGWRDLTNGELLSAAEQAGFDLLLTADINLRYQQNLSGRRIAIVALSTNAWPIVRDHAAQMIDQHAQSPGNHDCPRSCGTDR
jgi:hypothetical protein